MDIAARSAAQVHERVANDLTQAVVRDVPTPVRLDHDRTARGEFLGCCQQMLLPAPPAQGVRVRVLQQQQRLRRLPSDDPRQKLALQVPRFLVPYQPNTAHRDGARDRRGK